VARRAARERQPRPKKPPKQRKERMPQLTDRQQVQLHQAQQKQWRSPSSSSSRQVLETRRERTTRTAPPASLWPVLAKNLEHKVLPERRLRHERTRWTTSPSLMSPPRSRSPGAKATPLPQNCMPGCPSDNQKPLITISVTKRTGIKSCKTSLIVEKRSSAK